MVNNIMQNRKGFSLAEALVVMAVISIFFAAAAKVMTTKPHDKKQEATHGYYECYNSAEGFKQRTVNNGVAQTPISASGGICTFEPSINAEYYTINVNAGDWYYTSYEPNINQGVRIAIQENKIVISKDSESQTLDDTFQNDTKENISAFIGMTYPDSNMYNSGNLLKGILIGW